MEKFPRIFTSFTVPIYVFNTEMIWVMKSTINRGEHSLFTTAMNERLFSFTTMSAYSPLSKTGGIF